VTDGRSTCRSQLRADHRSRAGDVDSRGCGGSRDNQSPADIVGIGLARLNTDCLCSVAGSQYLVDDDDAAAAAVVMHSTSLHGEHMIVDGIYGDSGSWISCRKLARSL